VSHDAISAAGPLVPADAPPASAKDARATPNIGTACRGHPGRRVFHRFPKRLSLPQSPLRSALPHLTHTNPPPEARAVRPPWRSSSNGGIRPRPSNSSSYPTPFTICWRMCSSTPSNAKFIWLGAEQLDLGQSVQRIQTQRPDFSHDQIEEFLIEWIENWLRPRKLLLGATRRA
jgi:hypothetical protein